MQTGKRQKSLVIVNAFGLVGALVMNALANALPLNGKNTGEISDAIPDLFAPAGMTFAIWGVIYLLLVLLVVYQGFLAGRQSPRAFLIERMGPWFSISSAGNALWIVAWHWERQLLSFLLILLILLSLIMLYLRVNRVESALSPSIALRLPVSIYLGWITVAAIANLTTVLVVYEWNRFGLSEVFWTAIMIGSAVIINLLVLIREKDIGFALVGLWALFGIYMKRAADAQIIPEVINAAAAGMALLAVGIAVRGVMSFKEKFTVAK